MKYDIKKYADIFDNLGDIYKFRISKSQTVETNTMVQISALLLAVRAKFLFESILREDEKRNAYSSYVLTRAYFETCLALSAFCIKVVGKEKEADVRDIARRILLGGKHFPTNEFLEKVDKDPVKAFNVYDYIDTVDKNYRKVTGNKSAPHREMYDSVLSELGHPNFLGLDICSEIKKTKSGKIKYKVIRTNQSLKKDDQQNYSNYVVWGTKLFIHYWNDLRNYLDKAGFKVPSVDLDK